MIRRDDPAFRLVVNRELSRLYRSGQILQVFNRWFGRFGEPSRLLRTTYLIFALPE